MADVTLDVKAGTPIRISWAGNPWSLFGLCILNAILIVITVFIYWFWARTEYRRYMWQMVRVNGEPLEYTGKGKELFIGYLKLFLFVALPVIAILAVMQFFFGPQSPATGIVTLAIQLCLLFLYFVGVFRAHRYILSRTRWRGIAFGLEGNAAGYAWTSIWTTLLNGFTLGWIWPWRTMALRRRLTSAMHFGSVPFRFEGRSGPLYGPFAALWLCFVGLYGAFVAVLVSLIMRAQMQHPQQKGPFRWWEEVSLEDILHSPAFWIMLAIIPIALISLSWYEARKLNLFARATKIAGIETNIHAPGGSAPLLTVNVGGIETDLQASGGSLLWLTVSNLFILILSLGILRPVTQARRLRYLVTRMSFLGSADLDEVQRGSEREGSQGAGLEAAFSIEIF
jgi:uncharacterized membrane protein YjgN (DUF898 family)